MTAGLAELAYQLSWPQAVVTGSTIGATLLTQGGTEVAASSYATASVTPAANHLILLWVSANPDIPTSVTGCNLTWVLAATQALGNSDVFLYRALGAAPTTGAVTIAYAGNQFSVVWIMVDHSGTDTSGTNGSGAIVQTAGNNNGGGAATSITVTFGSGIGAGNAVAGGFSHGTASQAKTAGAGYTKLGEFSAGGGEGTFSHEWRPDGTTTPSMSWATSDVCWALAVEIKAAQGAPYRRKTFRSFEPVNRSSSW